MPFTTYNSPHQQQVQRVVELLVQVFLTGPRFKGMKMLPPGIHFLSYQAISKDGSLSPPVSTFLHLRSKQVYIRKWDADTEGLVPLEDEDEVSRCSVQLAHAQVSRTFD